MTTSYSRILGGSGRSGSWAVALAGAFALLAGWGPPPLAAAAADEARASLPARRLAAAQAALAERVGRPEAVAPLATLIELLEDVPPAQIEPLVAALATGPRTDPLVAAQAEHQLARLANARGDRDEAQRRWRALGLWAAWEGSFAVIGPFDAGGRGGLERVFPPELPDGAPTAPATGGAPAPARVFPGKERDVAWRVVDGPAVTGALALDGLLRPDRDAVAYVLTHVRSPRAQRVVLRLGSPGPTRVWVGGRPVFARDVVREARFDQDAVAITLPAGETAVLVKTVIVEGNWRLYLRLTDAAGRPLPLTTGVRPGARTPLVARGEQLPRPSGPEARELGALLRKRAEAAGADAAAWLDYGQWLGFSRQADREGKAEEAALERAAGAVPGERRDGGARADANEVAADALLRLGARAHEDEDRRRAFERAASVTRDPARKAAALVGLGELAQTRRRDVEAIAHVRAALAVDPDNVDAALALAVHDENLGLPALALARLERLGAGAQKLRRVVLARVRVHEALGRRAEVEAGRRALYAERRHDVELALALARAARERGDLAAAMVLHEEASRHHPGLPYVVSEWARLLEGTGDAAGARARLEAAAQRLPDDAGVWEELGRLLVRVDQSEAAIPALRRALVLRPQNPALRRYLARLEGERAGTTVDPGDDLARSHAEDGEALVRPVLLTADAAAPPPGRGRAGGTDVLLDKKVVRVHRNGLAERFVQRLVHVRTEQAVRDALEQGIRYTPGSQEVEIRRARIYRKSGNDLEVLEAAGRDDRDLSEPWYGLYYDVRAEVVLYEGLRPGDVLELAYTLADVSYENVLRDYFGDLDLIAEAAPRRRWEYVLIGPRERPFHFNTPKLPRYSHEQHSSGDEVVHKFVATDIAQVISEPGMPGWAEVAPYLHVSTYKSWDEVGRWYWSLVADQLAVDEGMRRAVREAVRGAPATLEKVRALHRLVLESTRYVGLEFGIHGYKPYKVTQVMARRFGDCKDKAALLHVFLREAGIPSEIVLLRTRRSGRVAPFPASLAVFDHAIVHVPALSLYLDGTAEFSGMDELPAEDQGVTVLRVGPRGATLAETPVLPSPHNRVVRRWSAALEPDGGARIEEEVSVSGQAAQEWREHYETPGERQERLARVWEGRFPGAKLEKVEIAGVDDRNRPVVARSVAQVPELAQGEPGAGLRLPVAAREPDFVRSYARLSARRQEYVLGYPFQHEEELRFVLPPGWRAQALPARRRLESPFGRFELDVAAAADGREVRVTSRTDIIRHRVPPADYPAFRAFLAQLDAALRQTIAVGPEAAR